MTLFNSYSLLRQFVVMLVKLKADKRAFLLYRRDKRRAAAAGAVHDCEFTPPIFVASRIRRRNKLTGFSLGCTILSADTRGTDIISTGRFP